MNVGMSETFRDYRKKYELKYVHLNNLKLIDNHHIDYDFLTDGVEVQQIVLYMLVHQFIFSCRTAQQTQINRN